MSSEHEVANSMTIMHQAMLIFVWLPIVYSISFFGWCYLAEKKPVFSKRNSRPISLVIFSHITALLILIVLAQIAFRFYPSLPDWVTGGGVNLKLNRRSPFEFFCVILVWAIGAIEMRWIYVNRGLDESESKDVSS
jgi:uncharacterized membrane protein